MVAVLHQQITALEPYDDDGIWITVVRIETDLVQDVEASEGLFTLLNYANKQAWYSALVYSAEERCVRIVATVTVHSQNVANQVFLAKNIATLQISRAQSLSEPLLSTLQEAIGQPQARRPLHQRPVCARSRTTCSMRSIHCTVLQVWVSRLIDRSWLEPKSIGDVRT